MESNRILSHLHPTTISVGEQEFASVEHAYKYLKEFFLAQNIETRDSLCQSQKVADKETGICAGAVAGAHGVVDVASE
uniref:Uncharacterized protein n=1 Tax=Romanomermis culicivorax TaxID=13658 RepID=A0A915HPT6_ROMCU